MNIKNRKNNTVPFIALTGVVVACILFVLWLVSKPHAGVQNPINLNTPSNQQTTAGEAAKKEFETKTTEASQQSESVKATNDTETSSPLTVYLQIASVRKSGDDLSVSTVIQTIDDSGECILTVLQNGTAKLTKTVKTQTMGSYSTCQNLVVNIPALQTGTYTVEVNYKGSQNRLGKASKEVTI